MILLWLETRAELRDKITEKTVAVLPSSNRGRMPHKANGDGSSHRRDIRKPLAQWLPYHIAGNNCRVRNYRCKPPGRGEEVQIASE